MISVSQIGTPQSAAFDPLSTSLQFSSHPAQNQLSVSSNPNVVNTISNGIASTTGAFYVYFFSAHPFLLPHHRQVELLKQRRIPHLELAIQYIGSCFLAQAPTQMYQEALKRMLSQQNLPRDAFAVQALLLFAIGLHANNDPRKAMQILDMAINIALEIGLNQRDYAMMQGCNDRVLEECYRRTWWSLYVCNGLFSGVNPMIPFRLQHVATDVPLPCEDTEYLSGVSRVPPTSSQCAAPTADHQWLLSKLPANTRKQIPFTSTLQDYDDAAFAPEQCEFSSFAYLIDAIRIMGRVLEVSRAESIEFHLVDIVDADL